MELSQLDDQYNWRRSIFGMHEESFGKSWSYNFRMPSDPVQLFQWIMSLDLPMLEDETPPPSFYFDLLETKDVELDRSVHSGKLLVTLGSQTTDGEEPQLEVSEEEVPKEEDLKAEPLPSPDIMMISEQPNSEDTIPSEFGVTFCSLPLMVEMGTGTDEPDVPRFVERGAGSDEDFAPEAIPSSTEDPHPPNPRSLGFFVKNAVIAISVLHTLYVLSKIAFGTSIAQGWESWSGISPPPPQIEETSVPTCIWEHVASKLAELRSRFS
ncbi:uncharacterized protein [Drosophila takahashii]|uniref:uncharacterized protein n=1 Tax=Drosophila takahashii TaxID=29030 RepID=UPI001CF904B1|nr:uncharacterized protein LOC108056404 [Drosophila takahashii]